MFAFRWSCMWLTGLEEGFNIMIWVEATIKVHKRNIFHSVNHSSGAAWPQRWNDSIFVLKVSRHPSSASRHVQELFCPNRLRALGLLATVWSSFELHSQISSFPHTQHFWNMKALYELPSGPLQMETAENANHSYKPFPKLEHVALALQNSHQYNKKLANTGLPTQAQKNELGFTKILFLSCHF